QRDPRLHRHQPRGWKGIARRGGDAALRSAQRLSPVAEHRALDRRSRGRALEVPEGEERRLGRRRDSGTQLPTSQGDAVRGSNGRGREGRIVVAQLNKYDTHGTETSSSWRIVRSRKSSVAP